MLKVLGYEDVKFKEHVEEPIGFMVIVLGMHFTNTNGLETIQTVKLFVGPSPCKFLTASVPTNCCWWRCAVGPQQHGTNTAVVEPCSIPTAARRW